MRAPGRLRADRHEILAVAVVPDDDVDRQPAQKLFGEGLSRRIGDVVRARGHEDAQVRAVQMPQQHLQNVSAGGGPLRIVDHDGQVVGASQRGQGVGHGRVQIHLDSVSGQRAQNARRRKSQRRKSRGRFGAVVVFGRQGHLAVAALGSV